MRDGAQGSAESGGSFRPHSARVSLAVVLAIAIVLLVMTGVFGAAEWYASHVSMPRYCNDPDDAEERVRRIVTNAQPAGAEPTRPYVVAAKLLFLVPQRQGETTNAYAVRLHERIEETCG